MELKEIKTFEELTQILPALVRLRERPEMKKNAWGGDESTEDFVLTLLGYFGRGDLIVWASIDSGELEYFMAVVKEEDQRAMFWLFYIDIKLRTISAELTQISIDKLAQLGYKKIQLTTRRIVKSYSRWMDKLGFKPIKIMYERNL
jgi:hypothetical protein